MRKNVNELTPEDVQALRSKLELENAELVSRGGAEAEGKTVLVALGDSWFDYSPGLDLIYWLQEDHDYYIENFGIAGDTLENMVYGTGFTSSNWRRYPCRINDVVETVAKLRPKAVLFSAGGNDLAGDPLDNYYNHVSSGMPPERADYMTYIFGDVFFRGYCDFVERMCGAMGTAPGEKGSPVILGHGYANAIPDGRAVINIGVFRFFGPWLRPTFTRKDLVDLTQTIGLVKALIGRFNDMLGNVHDKYPKNFFYSDFRDIVSYDDWANELHLTNDAYQNCAAKMAAQLKALGVGDGGKKNKATKKRKP